MIYGIGTDIVSLKRIIRLNKKFGLAFAQRILSPEELLEFPQAGKPVKLILPKRFAAKGGFCQSRRYRHTRRGVLPQYRCRA